MKVRLLFLFVAAGASAAIAADSTPESLTAHFGARGTAGLVEMLPNLSKDRGTLDGLRGCTNGTEECDPSARFRAARGYPLAGESLVLFLTGTQPVDVVRVKRNGATAIEQRDVTTPAELFLGTAVDGETIVAVVERGTESLEFNVTVGNDRKVSEKAAAAWGYIGNWV
ncbi:MAG: hypothetical protein H7Y20_03795, partial [Bryobacteraceae bacterium]|nr:hypothetical protein [Bryobacteraceae bacterium]